MRREGALFAAAVLLGAQPATAATYAVGPGRRFPDLQSVAGLLKPGDRVEVDGGATYPGGVVFREAGKKDAPITIAGVRSGDRRPVIAGGATTIELRGDHYVLEGFEITGGSARCLFHHADDVVVKDTVIHDCAQHGVLSADEGSGSLTLSYVEVYRAGRGELAHPVYVASDEEAFPRSVFRMEHSYVHDGLGGNNVKSRAERNEIYSNWIEGARFYELELIGPDGSKRKLRREDSDVVGNVIKKTGPGYAIRVGGDGSGETNGRYRFVNNTVLLGPAAGGVFRLMRGIESIEMHNNAFARDAGGPLRVLMEDDAQWAAGRRVIAGSCNWVPMGASGIPGEWKGTLVGSDPGFASPRDPRPLADSPLVGAGDADPKGPTNFDFPAPLAAPQTLPPPRSLERVGTAVSRLRGRVDIGAFPAATPPGAVPSRVPPPAPRGGCACRSAGSISEERAATVAIVVAIAALVTARLTSRRRRTR
jgi:hypothetical protein